MDLSASSFLDRLMDGVEGWRGRPVTVDDSEAVVLDRAPTLTFAPPRLRGRIAISAERDNHGLLAPSASDGVDLRIPERLRFHLKIPMRIFREPRATGFDGLGVAQPLRHPGDEYGIGVRVAFGAFGSADDDERRMSRRRKLAYDRNPVEVGLKGDAAGKTLMPMHCWLSFPGGRGCLLESTRRSPSRRCVVDGPQLRKGRA